MKGLFVLALCLLLFAGCSHQIIVMDGDCKLIQNAEVYYTIEGVSLYVPFGPIYTNQKGIVKVPSNTDSLVIKKENYKYYYWVSSGTDESFSWPMKIFLYKETEEYKSGLIDWNKCREGD